MRIVHSRNRLAFDVEDFITWDEMKMNKSKEHFKALVNAKLDLLRDMALNFKEAK